MTTQLVELHTANGTPMIPGVEFNLNQLVINERLEANALHDLTKFLLAVDGCSLFWFGDLLAYIKARFPDRGEEMALQCAEQSSNPDRLIDAMRVCEGLKSRRPISYAHHREAYAETGQDSAESLVWIGRAEDCGWTVAQMRAEIRRSKATSASEPSPSSIALTGDLSRLKSKISRMVAERPVEDWTLDEVSAIKADLEPLAAFVRRVGERWSEFNPALMPV